VELYIGIGVVVLVAVLLVGLFHGPSHRDTQPPPPSPGARTEQPQPGAGSQNASEATPPAGGVDASPPPLPADPPAYVLPPRRHHLPRRSVTGPRGRRP
jgi:hypothetical protein